MSGKCRDTDPIVVIPDKFRFVAEIYDFNEWSEEEEKDALVREVEIIDYKSGSIWYGGGHRSTNYKLIPKLNFEEQKEKQQ